MVSCTRAGTRPAWWARPANAGVCTESTDSGFGRRVVRALWHSCRQGFEHAGNLLPERRQTVLTVRRELHRPHHAYGYERGRLFRCSAPAERQSGAGQRRWLCRDTVRAQVCVRPRARRHQRQPFGVRAGNLREYDRHDAGRLSARDHGLAGAGAERRPALPAAGSCDAARLADVRSGRPGTFAARQSGGCFRRALRRGTSSAASTFRHAVQPTTKTDAYQILAGVEGRLAKSDWTWETYISIGDTSITQYRAERPPRFQGAEDRSPRQVRRPHAGKRLVRRNMIRARDHANLVPARPRAPDQPCPAIHADPLRRRLRLFVRAAKPLENLHHGLHLARSPCIPVVPPPVAVVCGIAISPRDFRYGNSRVP